MRKLIFIDNDDKKHSDRNIHYVNDFLKKLNFSDEEISAMVFFNDFWRLTRDEQANIIFDDSAIVVTWSVYTRSMMADSKMQLRRFLSTAGSYDMKNRIYIDASGMIKETLNKFISDDKDGIASILLAIKNNDIITIGENRNPVKCIIDLQGKYKDNFKYEPYTL